MREEKKYEILPGVEIPDIKKIQEASNEQAEAINQIIPYAQQEGYQFVPVGELIYREGYQVNQQGMQIKPKAENNDIAIEYLKQRGINEDVISYFIENGMLYQSVPMNNIVFVGYDENNKPKYAGMRGTEKHRYIGDAYGSDKTFPFRLANKDNSNIHIFEGAIDLLSYATLLFEQGSDFKTQNLVSLSGVYKPTKNMNNAQIPLSLRTVLKDNPQIKTVYLHLDNDSAGRKAAEVISNLLKNKYTVKKHFVPVGKDVNDYLCCSKNLPYRTFEKEVACR